MSRFSTLLDRNKVFAETFTQADLPILPKLGSVILACGDARVDPAHILGMELGDAVVIRNNGARVTPAFIEEIATLSFMVSMMTGDATPAFEVVLLQHTQCGAERFADPKFQHALKSKTGIDIAPRAITDHEASILGDIELMRNAPSLPDYIVVSGYIYDIAHGTVKEVSAAAPLRAPAD